MDSTTLWFATQDGISTYAYHPEAVHPPPPVLITVLRTADGQDLLSGANHPETDVGDLTIDYVGLSYRAEQATTYEYTLRYGEDDWKATKSSSLRLAAMRPGSYEFAVRALTADGIRSTLPAVARFTILAPVWQRWWFLTAVGLMLLLALWSVYRYRLRRILEMERMRTSIAMGLHDEVGTNLTRIAMFSDAGLRELRSGGVPATPTASGHLEDIGSVARATVDTLSDIVWAVDPRHDALEDILLRMKNYAARMLEAKGIEYDIDMPSSIAALSLPLETRKNLFLVFKEALTNVVKHSGATQMNLSLRRDGKVLILEITDNGRGFDPRAMQSGHGLRNMEERARALAAAFHLESAPGTGTRLRLIIQIA
jgi:signal transduction histidine kinase